MFRLPPPPHSRRGLFIMRIERAEGDKDPVRSLSPIHPLCLARSHHPAPSFFASPSLCLPSPISSIFRNEHTYSFLSLSLSLGVGIEAKRDGNETQQGGLNAAIFQGGMGDEKEAYITSSYPSFLSLQGALMGIKYIRGRGGSVPPFVPRSFSPSTPPENENRGLIRVTR